MILTYLFNGFLESGKTSLINETMHDNNFRINGVTLLISCEEGEAEYDINHFKMVNTVVEKIENEDDFTVKKLVELEQKHHAQRIIIEWNGMWDARKLKLPIHWKLDQKITTIDANMFELYYNNMRSQMMEMLKQSKLVVFNNCDNFINKLSTFKRNVQMASPQSLILFSGKNGQIRVSSEEDLPYDINSEHIVLSDNAFAVWCIDSFERANRYINKKFQFIAQVCKPADLPKNYLILGRHVVTCCDDDLSFFAHPAFSLESDKVQNRDWVKVTAKFTIGKCFAYEVNGPLLEVLEMKKISPPLMPVIR